MCVDVPLVTKSPLDFTTADDIAPAAVGDFIHSASSRTQNHSNRDTRPTKASRRCVAELTRDSRMAHCRIHAREYEYRDGCPECQEAEERGEEDRAELLAALERANEE